MPGLDQRPYAIQRAVQVRLKRDLVLHPRKWKRVKWDIADWDAQAFFNPDTDPDTLIVGRNGERWYEPFFMGHWAWFYGKRQVGGDFFNPKFQDDPVKVDLRLYVNADWIFGDSRAFKGEDAPPIPFGLPGGSVDFSLADPDDFPADLRAIATPATAPNIDKDKDVFVNVRWPQIMLLAGDKIALEVRQNGQSLTFLRGEASDIVGYTRFGLLGV